MKTSLFGGDPKANYLAMPRSSSGLGHRLFTPKTGVRFSYGVLMETNCDECKTTINYEDAYRCRICHKYFCSECSLKHFGLYENKGSVKHKSIAKTLFWMIRKKLGLIKSSTKTHEVDK